ncbi:hypothetical protein JRQ81_011917 [Phrynocephalus forsythii]|uniref:Uncharacterized protein n=1 Tax=Phrynocephalus forsythii TaxID=171643 RepID=A0A9Q1AQG4_9SAUR|nr:hypothetical protein JRQ81_011917 [Phrynocephalus forsythii]
MFSSHPQGLFPLGPFPRHIWIHHNTPQDSLDKACHEIWKRVQGLPEELQPRSSSPLLQLSCYPVTSSEVFQENGNGTSSSSQKESLEASAGKDEISLLVEQEYLSLTQENATELEVQTPEDDKVPPGGPCKHPANNNVVSMPSDGEEVSEEKDATEKACQSLPGNKKEVKLRPACDVHLSTRSTVTGILLPAKLIYKNAKGTESGNGSLMGSNAQIAKLLAQLPLKRPEAVKSLDSQMVMEGTKLIKDLLQHNMLGPAPHKESIARVPVAMTSTDGQGTGHKKQLPVFAKICSKSEPELVADGLCQSHASSPAIEKNNLKYNGNVFMPRFPTTSTTTSLKQPLWLSLNYPPPPVFPNHSNFPQYQSLYQQRTRIPFQQTLHPQLGCYSRQVAPYNPQQIFRSPYTPVLSYIPLVQPGYSYQQRNPAKSANSVRDPPAMAGDGPQYSFSPSYGFTSTTAGPGRTNPYFSSNGGGNSF